MAELNFPANPQSGDTYDYDYKRYRYDGIKWTTIKFVGDTAISLMGNHKAGAKEHSVAAIDWQGPVGFRNLLINGDFRVNQRNPSYAAVPVPVGNFIFVSDRWMSASVGASVNCQNVQTDGVLGVGYIVFTGAAGNTAFSARQRIEKINCAHLAGKKVTLSFNCYGISGATPTLSVSLNKAVTDNDYTNAVEVSKVNLVADGFKQVTFDIPSDASKGLEIVFMFAGLTTGGVVLHSVQFEQGAVATPFERRTYGHELALCQRYCVAVQSISTASEIIGIGGYTTGSAAIAQYFLTVQMRAVPKWVGGGVLSIASASTISPVSIIDMRGSTLTLAANQTNTVGQSCYTVSSGASAGFRGFDAEL